LQQRLVDGRNQIDLHVGDDMPGMLG